MSASVEAPWKSSIRSRRRVKRCGCTTAMTRPLAPSRAAGRAARVSGGWWPDSALVGAREAAPLGAVAGGGEDGADLGRVMAVIVDDGRALDVADLGEAALDAVELLEALRDLVVWNAELGGDADRGERVLDVVPSGHGELDVADRRGLAAGGAGRG